MDLLVSMQPIAMTGTMHAPTFNPTVLAAALGPGVHVWYPQIGDNPMQPANRARPRAHRARGR